MKCAGTTMAKPPADDSAPIAPFCPHSRKRARKSGPVKDAASPAGDSRASARSGLTAGTTKQARATTRAGASVGLLAQECRDVEHVDPRMAHGLDGHVAAAANRGRLVELLVVDGALGVVGPRAGDDLHHGLALRGGAAQAR